MPLQNRISLLKNKFAEVFGAYPKLIARAPGRVNLIGEHTDYNDGYVLPIAIDRDILVAVSPVSGSNVSVFSVDFERSAEFSMADIKREVKDTWSNYPRGVAFKLLEKGIALSGANMAIQGNVPLGSGLSSSAALEVACAMAFQAMAGFEMPGLEMALLCQAAEHEFAGVNCGIMDQFVSRLGVKDHALFIDCRTLEFEPVPLPAENIKVVVSNTLKKHSLVASEYNTRRSQCEEAVAVLKNHINGITALRDVTPADLHAHGGNLSPIVRKRAEHVVSENARVLASVESLKQGDIKHFGELMNQSHDSLRDLYEVSCDELDIMVEAARKIPGVYGSRMTGGGFGGCTVSLVADAALDAFLETVPKEYQSRTSIIPELYVCAPESGAGIVSKD